MLGEVVISFSVENLVEEGVLTPRRARADKLALALGAYSKQHGIIDLLIVGYERKLVYIDDI